MSMLQVLRAAADGLADVLERLGQLGMWSDPTWTCLAALLVTLIAFFIAVFGFAPFLGLILLLKMKPPWTKRSSPNFFACMLRRLPLNCER